MSDERGLYEKFTVRRNNSPLPTYGDKHYGCEYFVLDLTHDEAALPALVAYAEAANAAGKHALAADIRAKYLSGAR